MCVVVTWLNRFITGKYCLLSIVTDVCDVFQRGRRYSGDFGLGILAIQLAGDACSRPESVVDYEWFS
jgi:hypothetical protein